MKKLLVSYGGTAVRLERGIISTLVSKATRLHEYNERGWYTKPGKWRELVRVRVRDHAGLLGHDGGEIY
jgi:hypothetical protein